MSYREEYYQELEAGLEEAYDTLKDLGPQIAVDLGCGIALLGERLLEEGWNIEFVDVDPRSVSEAESRGITVLQMSLVSYLKQFGILGKQGLIMRGVIDYLSNDQLEFLQSYLPCVQWAYVTFCPAEDLTKAELISRIEQDGQYCRTSAWWNAYLRQSGMQWSGGNLWIQGRKSSDT